MTSLIRLICLPGVELSFRSALSGHADIVLCCAFSPSGDVFASGYVSCCLRFVNLCVKHLHSNACYCIVSSSRSLLPVHLSPKCRRFFVRRQWLGVHCPATGSGWRCTFCRLLDEYRSGRTRPFQRAMSLSHYRGNIIF